MNEQKDSAANVSAAACDECRNRKVKCDRRIPTCSNCNKVKIQCTFPQRDKRGSQVKQIATDVEAFHHRLSNLEGNLYQRIENLTDLVTQSVRPTQDDQSKTRDGHTNTTADTSMIDDDESFYPQDPESPGATIDAKTISNAKIIANEDSERYYRDASTYGHFVHARQAVKCLLEGAYNSSQSEGQTPNPLIDCDLVCFQEMKTAYDSYPVPGFYQENLVPDQKRPLVLPPRDLLEASFDFYRQSRSLYPPLFRVKSFCTAIEQQYEASAGQLDEAWVLCFNNVILWSLGRNSKLLRNEKSLGDDSTEEVMASLLSNAHQALARTEEFSALRLVNVQALLFLALAARDYIHFNIFERIFDRTCQLAKQMGFQERGFVGENPSDQDFERQNLTWVLYKIDKFRTFIRGSPPRIYMFECNLKLPEVDTSVRNGRFVIAHLKLACLMEEIYRFLHAPESDRQNTTSRNARAKKLCGNLDAWSTLFQPEGQADGGDLSHDRPLFYQLQYAYHVAKLLIFSRYDEIGDDDRFQTGLSALSVVQSLCSGSSIFEGGLMVLERLFADYSVITFYEVFEQLVRRPNLTKESNGLSLLSTTTNALGLLSHPSRPDAYLTRLHRNFRWCISIVTLIHKAITTETVSKGVNGDAIGLNVPQTSDTSSDSTRAASSEILQMSQPSGTDTTTSANPLNTGFHYPGTSQSSSLAGATQVSPELSSGGSFFGCNPATHQSKVNSLASLPDMSGAGVGALQSQFGSSTNLGPFDFSGDQLMDTNFPAQEGLGNQELGQLQQQQQQQQQQEQQIFDEFLVDQIPGLTDFDAQLMMTGQRHGDPVSMQHGQEQQFPFHG